VAPSIPASLFFSSGFVSQVSLGFVVIPLASYLNVPLASVLDFFKSIG
jgi:hypothetical protein